MLLVKIHKMSQNCLSGVMAEGEEKTKVMVLGSNGGEKKCKVDSH